MLASAFLRSPAPGESWQYVGARATRERTLAGSAVRVESSSAGTIDGEGILLPTFVTIGYGDRAGYDATEPALRDDAHRRDELLRARGAVMGIAGQAVQVRNHDAAGVVVSEGPFAHSDLPLAGFGIIEAASLDEAIELVAATPCAVAHGVVEVWPLQPAS